MRENTRAGLVGLVVAATFLTTLRDQLLWTDLVQIGQRASIWDSWRKVWATLSQPEDLLNYYRPLVHLLNTVDMAVWGTRFRGFHLTNIVLHGGNAALLFLVGLEVLRPHIPDAARRSRLAAIAAVAWGIHATKTESVAWLAGRSDLLQCLGLIALLWSLIVLRRSAETPPVAPPLRVYAGIAGLFLMSLLAKETSIVVPFLLAWTHVWLGLRAPRRIALRLYLAWFLTAGAYLAFRLLWLWRSYELEVRYDLGTRLRTQSVVLFDYLLTLAWPFRATASDVTRLHRTIDGAVVAAGAMILLAGLATIVFLFRGRRRLWVWAAGWFFVSLGPTANVLQQTHFRADRYLYLASFGLIVLAVAAADRGLGWLGARLTWPGPTIDRGRRLVVLVVLVALAVAATTRNLEWKNSETLFTLEVSRHPLFREGLLHLCMMAMARGDEAAALEMCRRGREVDRQEYAASVHTDRSFTVALGEFLAKRGKIDVALAIARESMARHPDDPAYAQDYQFLARMARFEAAGH